MQCSECGVEKISHEFPSFVTEKCEHLCTMCLRCLISHIEKEAICPQCHLPVPSERVEEIKQEAERFLLSGIRQWEMIASHEGEVDLTTLAVFSLDGSFVTVPTNETTMVGDLKREVEREIGIPLSRQIILLDGKILPSLCPVSKIRENMNSDSKLYVVASAYTEHAGDISFGVEVERDSYGNPIGHSYDLGRDGEFEGEIVVLQLYTGGGFDFSFPHKTLEEKGFTVRRFTTAPSEEELESAVQRACQVWLISTSSCQLSEGHLKILEKCFHEGKGLYIWGDNDPFYADANVLCRRIFGTEGMQGNLIGNQVVNATQTAGTPGYLRHLITTGLEHLFEGITIATISLGGGLVPLMWGSASNLVTCYYDKDGKRAIVDGGFTRLYCQWDTAGTARFVANSAVWLYNYERMLSHLFS